MQKVWPLLNLNFPPRQNYTFTRSIRLNEGKQYFQYATTKFIYSF